MIQTKQVGDCRRVCSYLNSDGKSSQRSLTATSHWNNSCGSTTTVSPLILTVDLDASVTAWLAFLKVNSSTGFPTIDSKILHPISLDFSTLIPSWAGQVFMLVAGLI